MGYDISKKTQGGNPCTRGSLSLSVNTLYGKSIRLHTVIGIIYSTLFEGGHLPARAAKIPGGASYNHRGNIYSTLFEGGHLPARAAKIAGGASSSKSSSYPQLSLSAGSPARFLSLSAGSPACFLSLSAGSPALSLVWSFSAGFTMGTPGTAPVPGTGAGAGVGVSSVFCAVFCAVLDTGFELTGLEWTGSVFGRGWLISDCLLDSLFDCLVDRLWALYSFFITSFLHIACMSKSGDGGCDGGVDVEEDGRCSCGCDGSGDDDDCCDGAGNDDGCCCD